MGCEHQLQLQWRICCAGAYSTERDLLQWGSHALPVCPFMCHWWSWLRGALAWSEAIHLVHWLWGVPEGARSATNFALLGTTQHKLLSKILMLGLEVPRRGKAINQVQLLLVQGLGPLSENYRACQGQMLLVYNL